MISISKNSTQKCLCRNLRHQLALATAEKQQQSGSCGQLEQLLADSRRENKALAEEVYSLKEHTASLEVGWHRNYL